MALSAAIRNGHLYDVPASVVCCCLAGRQGRCGRRRRERARYERYKVMKTAVLLSESLAWDLIPAYRSVEADPVSGYPVKFQDPVPRIDCPCYIVSCRTDELCADGPTNRKFRDALLASVRIVASDGIYFIFFLKW